MNSFEKSTSHVNKNPFTNSASSLPKQEEKTLIQMFMKSMTCKCDKDGKNSPDEVDLAKVKKPLDRLGMDQCDLEDFEEGEQTLSL